MVAYFQLSFRRRAVHNVSPAVLFCTPGCCSIEPSWPSQIDTHDVVPPRALQQKPAKMNGTQLLKLLVAFCVLDRVDASEFGAITSPSPSPEPPPAGELCPSRSHLPGRRRQVLHRRRARGQLHRRHGVWLRLGADLGRPLEPATLLLCAQMVMTRSHARAVYCLHSGGWNGYCQPYWAPLRPRRLSKLIWGGGEGGRGVSVSVSLCVALA